MNRERAAPSRVWEKGGKQNLSGKQNSGGVGLFQRVQEKAYDLQNLGKNKKELHLVIKHRTKDSKLVK